jgi:hypothetical protein
LPIAQSLRCPECNAALRPPAQGQREAKCEYCGVVARIPGNRTEQFKAVIQTAVAKKSSNPYAKPAVWLVIIILAPFVLPVVLGILFVVISVIVALATGVSTQTSGDALGLPLDASLQWSGTNAAMLYDVNGDGITDPIGHVRLIGTDEQTGHLAAFDAVTGERLWLTEAICDLSSSHQITAALVQDTLLYVDPLGVMKALSPATGQELWSAPLGERAERICAAALGLATVELGDKRRLNAQLATGQVSPAGQAGDGAPCSGVWSDKPGLTPFFSIDDRLSKIGRDMPEVPGMHVTKLVRDLTSPAVVALGYKTAGTRIPSAAAIVETAVLKAPSGKARKRAPGRKINVDMRWLSNVPLQNPLTVTEGEPDTAAIAMGRLIVPYEMSGSPSSERLSCLDLATGRALWEVEIPHSDTGDVAAVVANDRFVFVSMWTYLHIFDLSTGEHRTTIGKWM